MFNFLTTAVCFFIFLCWNFESIQRKTLSPSRLNDSVVTIFLSVDKNFEHTRKKNGDLIVYEKLAYIDSNFKENNLLSSFQGYNDTVLRINTREAICITYDFPAHFAGRKLNYLVQPGDSIQIEMRNGLAYCSILNRSYDTSIYHFWTNVFTDSIYPESFKYIKGISASDYVQKRIDVYKKMLSKLDHLWDSSVIKDTQVYNFTRKYLGYELANDFLIGRSKNKDKDSIIREYAKTVNVDMNMLNNPTYQRFIIEHFEKFEIPKAAFNQAKNGIKIDYTKAFDVAENKANGLIRDFLLTYCLEQMHENESKKMVELFHKKWAQSVLNKRFHNRINMLYIPVKAVKAGSDQLLTNSNHITNYDSLISSYKGKFIYMDFWASWCMPCRAEMPDSRLIQQKYKDKNIVFLYISIDKNPIKWRDAAKEEKLEVYSNSFLLLNSSESTILKKFRIETIPRYVLIDAEGKIIYANAPGPSEKKLQQILDSEMK
jgi:thiol-disulfide isomerase/thioredoxin